jgi:hypothetical protein
MTCRRILLADTVVMECYIEQGKSAITAKGVGRVLIYEGILPRLDVDGSPISNQGRREARQLER